MRHKPSLHYAQIEKETLAIVYGAQKFHRFIYERPTVVESDHKPLQYILNRPLHQAPLRLQKMMLTLQRCDLKVKYRPGVELSVADALSRSYLPETALIPDLEVNEVHLTTHLPISPEKYVEMQQATAADPVMQATVISKHHTPRSYIVQTQEGQKYRRNRRHLNKCRPSKDKPTASVHDQPKASPNIHTSKDNKVPLPTTEASPPQVQKPPVRTRSGRLIRKPA